MELGKGGFPKEATDPKTLTYNTYLKVPELLSLQKRLSEPPAHDEFLFIIIHQVYELWFRLITFELEVITKNVADKRLPDAFRGLDRVLEIFGVLVQQIDVLETMSPTDFNKFRGKLNPASGFQSLQFRTFEILSGADIADYDKFSGLEPEWKDELATLGAKMSLRGAFLTLLKKEGLSTADLKRVYEDEKLQLLRTLCEYLIRYDEQIQLWRFRHVQMVERMIGMKMGTGGSLGATYLRSTLKKRFFPELWDARTEMETSY